ncbi:magnesium transporter CorA family protein [Limosilactobacillus sp.]|uniref:magnesium transporter CorA family protein n=1 Tax=Limosilactobacillus sp. TaxID=2773925 RepID=UPI00345E766E
MIKEHHLKNYLWLEVTAPAPDEIGHLVSKYQLPRKIKNYMLDRHEQPRATYDMIEHLGILVLRCVSGPNGPQQSTTPLFLGFNKNLLVTVIHVHNQQRLFANLPLNPQGQIHELIFRIVSRTLEPYFVALNDIIDRTDKLSNKQLRRITNARLDELSLLKTRLIYLRSATASNLVALQELQTIFRQRYQSDSDESKTIQQALNDTLVEFKQCQAMFDVVSEEVSEAENSFGNLLNNRLNDTMKFLTVWSLLLAIPPIISGFYGENVSLPLAGRHWAWVDTLLMTAVLMLLMILIYVLHVYRRRK